MGGELNLCCVFILLRFKYLQLLILGILLDIPNNFAYQYQHWKMKVSIVEASLTEVVMVENMARAPPQALKMIAMRPHLVPRPMIKTAPQDSCAYPKKQQRIHYQWTH